ncbi:MAG: polysaccharide deacetylase family protein [Candidatus Hydrogenedentes bacterium]|nr:polysaccharide deacetylase family protein [Candidatus Hydrogenedentota bacterium]
MRAIRFSILLGFAAAVSAVAVESIPDKTVVLTFDDAVKSHRTFVGPLLKEYGFGASFFVTALWMSDTENFMNWQDIAELHQMGFEIGNHSWSHSNFGNPKYAAQLEGQIFLVEQELAKAGVPKPTSFAWCGNTFSPEGVDVLKKCGYTLARRGMQPEIPYGQIKPGPMYAPANYDPLLIPSAGDAYPSWTLDDFKRVVDRAKDGTIAVVQFHGVPDIAHPWVHTPPERFREYMDYLKQNGFNVIAMRGLARYIDPEQPAKDAMTMVRYTSQPVDLPAEVHATRANPAFWFNVMKAHNYTEEELASVFGWPVKTLQARAPKFADVPPAWPPAGKKPRIVVLPYPGGRHPRIGFLDGAVSPLRGSKVSIFAPWQDGDRESTGARAPGPRTDPNYVVLDIPEAIFSNLGLTFLAHTHVQSMWDKQHQPIENNDWELLPNGDLENEWTLPNNIKFGARVMPKEDAVDLELWLENGSGQPLTGLRTQICAMLKGMPGFNAQTKDNKRFDGSVASTRMDSGEREILIAFDRCGRVWGNEKCPCMHSDPVLPDAAPGQRVSVKGRLWFLDAIANRDKEVRRAQREFAALERPPVK